MDTADRIERAQPLSVAGAAGASARRSTARVIPPLAGAGETGTVQAQLEVGAEGVALGGGIRQAVSYRGRVPMAWSSPTWTRRSIA